MITLSKEPLYAATQESLEWGPADLSEPWDDAAYCEGNASKVLQTEEWALPEPEPEEPEAPIMENGTHTYVGHYGGETVELTIVVEDGEWGVAQ